jgi:hypothetical protein
VVARELCVGSGVALVLLAAASGTLATGCPGATCEDTATCSEPANAGGSSGGTLAGDGASVSTEGAPAEGGASSDDGDTSSDGEEIFVDGAKSIDGATLPDGAEPPDGCQPNENCANGTDDDCNGLVDCADPACQEGFTCVEATPAGWSGPGIFFASSDATTASLPACPPAYSVDAVDGVNDPSAPPAACQCACGPPSGVACTPSVSFYYDSACANLCETESLSLNACVASCAGAQTMSVSLQLSGSGGCAPRPSTQVPTATWGSTARVCAPAKASAGSGCSAGQICVAKPPSPFDSGACFWQSGAVSCPDPSDTRYVYFASTNPTDNRGCSACTCSAAQGVTCGGSSLTTFATFSDGSCDDDAGIVTQVDICIDAPASAHGVVATSTGTATAGSCGPSAVSPTGSFTPSSPTTICCLP